MSSFGYEVKLGDSVDEAIVKVTAALKEEGFGVLTRIDVDSALKEKIGVDFRPYVILGACNPKLAYRALTREPQIGLMLPCNVTVEADGPGGSLVRIVDPQQLLSMGGMEADDEMGRIAVEARERLERVAQALS